MKSSGGSKCMGPRSWVKELNGTVRTERGNSTIPWNMMTGQRSGLRHLWLVAGRQPKDKLVYVRLRKAMREKMSFAYGILKNGMGCTWGTASCLEW